MTPLPRRGLYAVTDPTLLPQRQLLTSVELAIRGGAVMVQFRDKGDHQPSRRRQAQALLRLCRRHGVPLIINDDVMLAKEVGADGVHLGREDTPVSLARELLGAEAIIGLSCYNLPERAFRGQEEKVSYVAFGRFFASSTKPAAVQCSPELLRQVAPLLSVPVVAIGGITPENGASLLRAGADLLAVIGGLFAAPDPYAAATDFARLF